MGIKANTTAFERKVVIVRSGEQGLITGYAHHMRLKEKQFFVEYQAADGRAVSDWFFESELEEV